MLRFVGSLLLASTVFFGACSWPQQRPFEEGVAYVWSGGEFVRQDGHQDDCPRFNRLADCPHCAEWLYKAIVGTSKAVLAANLQALHTRLQALEVKEHDKPEQEN